MALVKNAHSASSYLYRTSDGEYQFSIEAEVTEEAKAKLTSALVEIIEGFDLSTKKITDAAIEQQRFTSEIDRECRYWSEHPSPEARANRSLRR